MGMLSLLTILFNQYFSVFFAFRGLFEKIFVRISALHYIITRFNRIINFLNDNIKCEISVYNTKISDVI